MDASNDAATDPALVIVGGGLAGMKAIEELREQGHDGPITLVAAEDHLPYERPVLSKGFLLGSESRDSAFSHDQQWYADHDVDLLLADPAARLDPAGHTITTQSGLQIAYRKLLLATGSEPRTLPLPGADAANVFTLRDVDDADKIDSALTVLADSGRPLVIIGGGWIGLEVAAAARQRDIDVTVLEALDQPLLGVLGAEVARVFADLHTEHGVHLVTGAKVSGIATDDGRATAVSTEDGARYGAGAVLIGIGAAPRISLAADAGLAVDHGVLTDGSLQTSAPDVYAAGDIAEVDHPLIGGRVRVEHWAWANDTGPVAARAMLGQDSAIDFLPFFFTDQYDLGMEYIGYVAPGSRPQVELRGDVGGRQFQAYWIVDGKVAAGMHVNDWDNGIDPIKEIVLSGDSARIPS
ncbi:pyridine nucleotide-disulfide oxidoreductase [Microlunatus endophyticus]|uniref:Pyridine nucleotide-disulfide oxidoreductase n=1 Tax=Microlunatus endophyticus TaxID=1716077 RepID=A0A917S7L0_9ACTN|nr:FAD-dependent oxidoreductase [Microlunatus endophyticus]GGL59931.1 pyridine nucleotide-disulfide oxidoreductase [Microlunatus endophyticus]